jgi:asparagine synthase (glutamine-hydrolysing)
VGRRICCPHERNVRLLYLYDRRRDRFVLGRDRLGIKPLYYVEKQNQFVFASNIQALNAAGAVDHHLSPTALHYYLTFHAVVPAPYTIFKNVKKLEPATLMVIDKNGRKKIQRYSTI